MHKSRNRRFHFNMFEIVLAIAILAFGFASVLGLFPVGLKALRNSQAEGLVSNAVNNIYVYYKSFAHATKSPGVYFHGDLFIDASTYINWTAPDDLRDKAKDTRSILYGQNFLDELYDSVAPTNPTDPKYGVLKFQPGLGLFQPEANTLVFFLILGSSDFKKTEFTAQIIVWKKKIIKIIAGAVSVDELTYKQAVELNMEVTWPINIPYADREKRHYQFVITNPDQTP